MDLNQFQQIVKNNRNLSDLEKEALLNEVHSMDVEKQLEYFQLLTNALAENDKIDNFADALTHNISLALSKEIKKAKIQAEESTFVIAKDRSQKEDVDEMDGILNELENA